MEAKKKLLHHLNLFCYEKKIEVILPLTPLLVICIPYGLAVSCCVFNLCVFRPSLLPTPTAPAQQFQAKGSWQTQKGFWDMQPYEFFIHFPPPTIASFLKLAVVFLCH